MGDTTSSNKENIPPPETPSLSSPLPEHLLSLGPPSYGEGEPPVKGAIPAVTARDKDGNIHIGLCRQYAGSNWVYTTVADGWITITNEDE